MHFIFTKQTHRRQEYLKNYVYVNDCKRWQVKPFLEWKMPPLNIKADKPRYRRKHSHENMNLHRIEHRISRYGSRRAVIAGRLSPQIVITAWIFQSNRVIDDTRTMTIGIVEDVLFPYVNRLFIAMRAGRSTWKRDFIEANVKIRNRCNRFQNIEADKWYSRSEARAVGAGWIRN